jgi:hypothetical protein
MVATAHAVAGPTLTDLRDEIVRILERHKDRPSLRAVGGNLLIMIPEVATWTVVTQGPRTGLYEEATEDPIRFAMACDEPVLLDILSGREVDVEQLTLERRLAIRGDARILDRLLSLESAHDLLSIRGGK